jgi:hypothetical protein
VSYLLIQRLVSIRDEYEAARVAVKYLERSWHRLSDLPETRGVRFSHVQNAVHNLEVTYIIRLFAAFESLLHDFLIVSQPGRAVPRRAEHLVNRVARRARIPDLVRDAAQEVREYRNSVIHPGATAPTMAFEQALAKLNRFLAPLPDP